MTRRLLVTGAALAAACASRTCAGTSTPAPVTSPPSAPAAAPVQPIAQPAPRRSDLIHYGPSALRYVVHRQLHIQQGQAERPQAQDLGARIYVAATIAGPADSVGYPATFTVDSIVPDSGTPPPVAENVSKARKLVFSGRLLPRGEFANAVPSDSVLAQSLVQLLASFRDFLPRLPREGLKPGAAWTDTLEATQRGASSEVTRRAIVRSAAAAGAAYAVAHSVRLESSSTYQVAGAGQNGGQPFELAGSGSSTAVSFIAVDGRYLGGGSPESSALRGGPPGSGNATPAGQLTHTTAAGRA